jgi:hypothetical protein
MIRAAPAHLRQAAVNLLFVYFIEAEVTGNSAHGFSLSSIEVNLRSSRKDAETQRDREEKPYSGQAGTKRKTTLKKLQAK